MHRHCLTASLLLAAAVSLSACNREQPVEPASTAPIATEPMPAPAETVPQAIETTIAKAGVQQTEPSPGSRDPGPDVPAVVGVYTADGATLEIKAGGTWQRRSAAGAQATAADTGTWTLEKDGTQLLLDSDDKAVEDARFAVASSDSLKPLGSGSEFKRVH